MAVCCPFVGSSSPTAGRVVVDGATSEWTPIIPDMPQGNVLGPLLFILYTSEIFELVDNRLYVCADDSTLLQLFASQQTVLLLLPPNRDLARIQEWCNHWCILLNPNKTKALVVSKSRTVNPWSSLGFPFALVPTSIFLVWNWTAGSHSKTICMALSPVSLKEFVFWCWWSVSLWISLCCFVATLHLFS